MKTGYIGKPVEVTHAPPSSPVNLLAERKNRTLRAKSSGRRL
jgi:hypothetical protein